MIKSPLRYPGGKSKAVKFLKNYFPEFSEFREPFLGGASVAFYIAQEHMDKKIITSDLNYELYCFWNVLKNDPKKMVREVQKIFNKKNNGRELFQTILKRRNNNLTEVQRSVDFFILNRITFSGVVDSGGYSEASFQNRFTQSSIDRLSKAAPIVARMNIFNNDYKKLISKKGRDVFIFFDPPYHSCTSSKLYGKKGILHQQFDHEIFYNSVRKSEHKWLITYDNSEYISELYKDFFQVEWELQYGMNNYKQKNAARGKELLIANYDITKMNK